jgi:predicted amidohydrolase
MKIAVYQGDGTMADVEGNLDVLSNVAGAAAEKGACLVIFPELFLTGYNTGAKIRDLAEPCDGPASRKALDIARESGVCLLYGYAERAADGIYNSALMVDRDGSRRVNYRKTHLFSDYERNLFRPGKELVTTELDGFKIGVLICFDIEFPEPARALALRGIDLLAVPTTLMAPHDVIARIVVPARACENQIFVAYANRHGQERELKYIGQSCIVGPDGRDLARAGKAEELLVADIDANAIAKSREAFDYLNERQPNSYGSLI